MLSSASWDRDNQISRRSREENMKVNNYQEYLNSQYWKDFRVQYFKKKKRRYCCLCSSTKNLNVHHLRYLDKRGKSFLGREPNSIMRTLCGRCHRLYHSRFKAGKGSMKYIQRMKNLIVDKGFTPEEAIVLIKK